MANNLQWSLHFKPSMEMLLRDSWIAQGRKSLKDSEFFNRARQETISLS